MDNDTKLINLALDAGELMLKNGAETFRVQDTMQRILATSGREKIEASAISTALIVTLPREKKGPLSMMRGVRTRTINFDKVCAVNDVSRAFVSGAISLDAAIEKIAQIHTLPCYPLLLRIFGYGVISGCFSFLDTPFLTNGCIAFCIGLLLGCLDIWLGTKKIPYFLGPFLGGAAAASLACLAKLLVPAVYMDTIIIGSIMPLLPGMTFAKAMRDLLEGNLISGYTKGVEALVVACSLAGGVGLTLSYLL